MLYHLLYPLHTQFTVLNVTRYITFRTAAASLSALVIGLFVGPVMIRKLREFQIGQVVRQDGPATHRTKAGTPTMGGLLILTSVLVPDLDLGGPDQPVHLGGGAGDGGIRRDRFRRRLPQDRAAIASRAAARATRWAGRSWPRRRSGSRSCCSRITSPSLYSTRLIFPFFKRLIPDLGWFYVVFAVVFLVGATNEVNLTDGLDGLAISVFAVSAAAFTGARVRVDARGVLQLPAARPAQLRGGGADHLLRCARRRQPRLPLVELLSGGNLHGRRRVARPGRRAWHRRAPHQAGDSLRRRRRRLRHGGRVGHHPGRARSR